MKSLADEAARILTLHAQDLLQVDDVAGDAPMVRHLAAELRRLRRFLLPVGGELSRQPLIAQGSLDVRQCRFPEPGFVIEFNVSESGMPHSPEVLHILPTFFRMALVQDLRDPGILANWAKLLSPYPALCELLKADSLLIVPINRVSDPNEATGEPGNRGWMPGWSGVLVPMGQDPSPVSQVPTPQGPQISTALELTPLPLGAIGSMTADSMLNQGLDLAEEGGREFALEMLAALDLGLAFAAGTANLRRYEMGGRNVWRAGTGPLMPARLMA